MERVGEIGRGPLPLAEQALGRWAEAEPLYHWFLPLLRMDVVPKFVQLIKLVQSRVSMGRATVRAPRLMLVGEELEQANAIITQALASKPTVPAC